MLKPIVTRLAPRHHGWLDGLVRGWMLLVLLTCTTTLRGQEADAPDEAADIEEAADEAEPGELPEPDCEAPEEPEFSLDNPSPQTQAKVDSLIKEMLDPEVVLEVSSIRSKLVRTRQPVSRFSVTDPAIVEVVQFGPNEFELIGGEVGETTLTMWFGEADDATVLRYLVKVVQGDILDRRITEYGELQDMVNELFPNSAIQLIPVADKLIVRGQARDPEEVVQIMSVIRGRAIDQSGGLIGPGSNVFGGGGAGISQGPAAVVFPGESNLPASNIINLLTTPGEMQVLLKVRVAELTRSALRELGVDFTVAKRNFFLSSMLGSGGNIRTLLDGQDINLLIRAFSSNGNSKILAEPNLIALSGQSASFIAGGQFAVPTVVGIGGAAAATTSFQGFGTQVTFTPTVIDKDRIRLQVSPTFSTLNRANAVNGIPGLNTRSVFTTVDMREGQWLALAGLIQDEQSSGKAKVPFLGDIPILDAVFSHKDMKRAETELIVLVSPELIHPMECEQVPPLLPGMEVTEPGPLEFFALGRIEGDPECHHRSTVWPVQRDYMRDAIREAKMQARFQRSQGYYIAGPHGFSE